jgi:signal transduction histidine kinase
MRGLLNLSFRYKVPLWGSGLIVMAAVAVSLALMVQAYDGLRGDLVASSNSLARTLAKNLFPVMLNDEVWRAYEIIRAPLHGQLQDDLIQPEMIFALDRRQRVFVSSDPRSMPMLADVSKLGFELDQLASKLAASPEPHGPAVEFTGDHKIYVAVPIAEDGERLGSLVIVHSKDRFLPRFRSIAWRGGAIGFLIVAILLPLNWYWGQRMAVPLVKLARNIGDVAQGLSAKAPALNYPYRDELGHLFEAYQVMVKALREKQVLEQEMIRSERLAAVGRLSAGLAHEINNPLGGMLVALDNFKLRGGHDERTLKTMAMIERGLAQVRETVNAMLVEVKVKSRNFGPMDVDDVQTLLMGEAHKRAVEIHFDSNLVEPLPLPATQVRQILMNLLLNALQAAKASSVVRCTLRQTDKSLSIESENSGETLPAEVMSHLFEPFVGGRDGGNGLGLWIIYQIVSQLGGQIKAHNREDAVRFSIVLPLGEVTCQSPCGSV